MQLKNWPKSIMNQNKLSNLQNNWLNICKILCHWWMYTDWYQLICRWWVTVVNWYLGLWALNFHLHDYVEWDDFGFMILQIGEGKILPFNPKRNDQLRFIVEMIGDGLNKFLTPNVGPSILLPETTECCGKVWKILFANCLALMIQRFVTLLYQT